MCFSGFGCFALFHLASFVFPATLKSPPSGSDSCGGGSISHEAHESRVSDKMGFELSWTFYF